MKKLIILLAFILLAGCLPTTQSDGEVSFIVERTNEVFIHGEVCVSGGNVTDLSVLYDSADVSKGFPYKSLADGQCVKQIVTTPKPVACQATGFLDGQAFIEPCVASDSSSEGNAE